jgi:phenylalanyl-tRNA synthetase alpha chain
LHRYETAVLSFLQKHGKGSVGDIDGSLRIGRDSVLWAIESLLELSAVEVDRAAKITASLTEEGKSYAKLFPEEKLLDEIKGSEGRKKITGKEGVGLIWAKKNGWVTIENGVISLTESGKKFGGSTSYPQRKVLNEIVSSDDLSDLFEKSRDVVKILSTRGLIETKEKSEISEIKITKTGMSIKASGESNGSSELTREMISSGAWKSTKFRNYDIGAEVEPIYPARLHPVREFVNYIRDTWVSMGFIESSGPIVESAFWNFDALFSPQDHPTRDMQDTFFISNPKELEIGDLKLLSDVRSMHTNNWGKAWREEIAKQPLLRTHTTSVSARNIKKLANAVTESPLKLFSVGKVFRNESIDYKHLAEFHQMDGIIIGRKLGMAHLIHTLKEFYGNMGLDTSSQSMRIKPAYFPFVEPGLEIQYTDKNMGTEIELCGGGVIRKEISKALGTNMTILAWGGGLERLMFYFMKLDSITELYKNDVGWLRRRDELKL